MKIINRIINKKITNGVKDRWDEAEEDREDLSWRFSNFVRMVRIERTPKNRYQLALISEAWLKYTQYKITNVSILYK